MERAILLQPEYEGNVGFVARLVANFDVDELAIVDPQCEIGEEARKRAGHAQEVLASARTPDSLDPVIDDLDYLAGTTGIGAGEDNVLRHGVPPRAFAAERNPGADLGLLFGREGKGLSNMELDRCDAVITIPASDDYPVMNLSHAAAVVFHELFAAEGEEREPSSRREREALENLFKGVAGRLDWQDERRRTALRAFRNVLGRSRVTGRELQLLLGLFGDIKKRLGDE